MAERMKWGLHVIEQHTQDSRTKPVFMVLLSKDADGKDVEKGRINIEYRRDGKSLNISVHVDAGVFGDAVEGEVVFKYHPSTKRLLEIAHTGSIPGELLTDIHMLMGHIE